MTHTHHTPGAILLHRANAKDPLGLGVLKQSGTCVLYTRSSVRVDLRVRNDYLLFLATTRRNTASYLESVCVFVDARTRVSVAC